MKKPLIIALFVGGSVSLATLSSAVTVTYNFDSGLGGSTSGADLTAGVVSYAVGTQSDGSPDSSERAWDPSTTSGDYLLNIGQRGLGNSGVADANLTTTAAATLQFTLTPTAGQAFDFSLSTIGFNQSVYLDNGDVNFAYKVWADTGSGFVAVGALQTMGKFTFTSGTENRLKQTDESTDLPLFFLDGGSIESQHTAFSFNIASLGVLAADQAVTFAIAISTDRNNQFNVGNGIDDLVVDNIAIPEPGIYALLGGLFALSFVMRRRRH